MAIWRSGYCYESSTQRKLLGLYWVDLTLLNLIWNWKISRPNTTIFSCIIIQLKARNGAERIAINITAVTSCCSSGVDIADRKSDLLMG